EVFLDWIEGKPLPRECANLEHSLEYAALRKALNSSLRAALKLKVGLTCAYDTQKGASGSPASQGLVNPDPKYADPLMQLCLTYMLSLYCPPSNSFIRSVAPEISDALQEGSQARIKFDAMLASSLADPKFNWQKELAGSDEAWKVEIRLELA